MLKTLLREGMRMAREQAKAIILIQGKVYEKESETKIVQAVIVKEHEGIEIGFDKFYSEDWDFQEYDSYCIQKIDAEKYFEKAQDVRIKLIEY